ncbi:MAG TPA: porin family protein [Chitinophagales bacterium]|nr:porin family protein [Chitinophagales bacterium]
MKKSALIASLLFSTGFLFGQEKSKEESIFKAALIMGFNATQVDGDDLAGYRKIGANAGGAAYVRLPKNFSFSFEILYSQKGSRSSASQTFGSQSYKLILDYVDVPVAFNYHDRDKHDRDIAIFGLGVVLNSLVRYKELRGGGEYEYPEGSPYRRFGAEVLGNVTFLFAKHFGVNLRFTYSLTNITNRPLPFSNLKNGGQRNNVVTLRGMYFF